MDFARIKAEIIRKYSEGKNTLSNINFWSYVQAPNYATFKTSQLFFRQIKSFDEITVLEEKVSAGKMALIIKIPEIKLDDTLFDTIEIIQDIETKRDELTFQSFNFEVSNTFDTKNIFRQKDINLFDIKSASNNIIIRIGTNGQEFIELHTFYS
jgi:hypothetical protein